VYLHNLSVPEKQPLNSVCVVLLNTVGRAYYFLKVSKQQSSQISLDIFVG